MSTFAVFGMTRDQALADARKNVKTTRRTPQGEVAIPLSEWVQLCEKRADEIMAGTKVKQLGPLFDAPQYADEFIALARRTLKCRDLQIRCKAALTDAQGNPLINKKTKAPKVGWQDYEPDRARSVA
ncbi:hypothetical protein SA496_15695 [Pseudomonas sp. JS3066]|uniref:hypothetical protein n=1 Tax=Pseudomonas sp. JS3066 TaxID=3090665 RepID=UPI002E7BBC1D|nr:hypothetical protein [Pseudomonas sp. JS3066]WVK91172.1 hypothetical protein SA496_15695 [Pseudomonas sp. JS3066]